MNMGTLGISDHFPYEFYSNFEQIPYQGYSMTLEQVEEYLNTIENLKEKYKKEIDIKLAFEIDYIINQHSKFNQYIEKFNNNIDYFLGSIHILSSDKGFWTIDDPSFREEYETSYDTIDDVYLQYYNTQIEMINKNEFSYDIVSHLSLIHI